MGTGSFSVFKDILIGESGSESWERGCHSIIFAFLLFIFPLETKVLRDQLIMVSVR